MPLLTVIAPGTRVVVAGMGLPEATVERVEMAAGVNPVRYGIKWRETPFSPWRRATFNAAAVSEAGAGGGE